MYKLSTAGQTFVTALRALVRSRVSSDRGATAVEYGLLVALIAIAIIGAVFILGTNLNGVFGNAGSELTNAA